MELSQYYSTFAVQELALGMHASLGKKKELKRIFLRKRKRKPFGAILIQDPSLRRVVTPKWCCDL